MNPQSLPAGSDGLFNEQVTGALRRLIERYGVDLLGQSGRLRGLLQDECPQAKKEISVLLQALDERVPQDLLRVHSGEPIASLSPRLVKRLTEEKSLSADASRWAVHAWAQSLGVGSAIEALPPGAAMPPVAANETWQSPPQPMPVPAPAPVPVPKPAWQLRALIGAVVVAAVAGFGWWSFSPRLEIRGVEAAGPLVGNGKPQPLFAEFDARRTVPATAEVRFVRGDGEWKPERWTVKLEPDPAQPGRVAVGGLQTRTTKSINATFEFVLVGQDGQRSGAFERSFAIVPPVTITQIRVPRPLRTGQNFALAIGYEKGAADIVQVERKVIDSSVPWPQATATQTVKAGGEKGSLDYRFEAFTKPARSTLEFTLVDAAGVRSDPVRVSLDVGTVARGTGPGVVVAVVPVQQAPQAGPATGVGAVLGGLFGGLLGNQVGGGSGKAAATVAGVAGGAWAGNEAEKTLRGGGAATGTAAWDTTVRFDDGTTRVIRTSGAPRWRAGDRVSFEAGVLSPG